MSQRPLRYTAFEMLATIRQALAAHTPSRIEREGLPRAAVLIPIYDVDETLHIILQVRTELVEHHKGQISFPGGGEEPGDRDLLDTALRETYEEIGLDPSAVEVWGRLDETETVVSGFAITPYVGKIPPPDGLRPNPNEIDQIITVPLAVFLNPAQRRVERVVREGQEWEIIFFDYPPHVIWGATARIISSMIRVARRDS